MSDTVKDKTEPQTLSSINLNKRVTHLAAGLRIKEDGVDTSRDEGQLV
jgi:hypothetical protein